MILPILPAAPPDPYVLASPLEARFEYAVPGLRNGVTVDRSGTGRVWRYGTPSRLVAIFQTEAAYARASGNEDLQAPIVRSNASGDRALLRGADDAHPSLQVIQTHPFRPLYHRADSLDSPETAQWSPDGRTLLLPRTDGHVLALDDAGRVRATFAMIAPFAFQNGHLYGRDDRGFVVVDAKRLRVVRHVAVRTAETPFGVSPDGRWIVAGGRDRTGARYRYHVWRASDGRGMAEFPGEGLDVNSPLDPQFLGGGRFALYARGEVRALPSGRLLRRIPPIDSPPGMPLLFDSNRPLNPVRATLPEPPQGPQRVWPLPDGRLVAPGVRTTFVLDPRRHRAWSLPQFPTNGVKQVVRRADGSVVLNGLNGVRILDPTLRTSRFVRQPKADGEFGSSESVLDPDGRTAMRGGAVGVRWRVDDGKVLGPATGGPSWTFREVAAPDGGRYRTFGPFASFERVGGWSHAGKGRLTSSLSFTADGSRVAFVEDASHDLRAPRLRVLDAQTGASLVDEPVPISEDAAISPDGSRVALLRAQAVEIRRLGGASRLTISARMPSFGEIRWWGSSRLLLSGGGTLQAIDADRGRIASTWAQWGDGGWVAWTPEGAEDGDARGLSRLVRRADALPVGHSIRAAEIWRSLTSSPERGR